MGLPIPAFQETDFTFFICYQCMYSDEIENLKPSQLLAPVPDIRLCELDGLSPYTDTINVPAYNPLVIGLTYLNVNRKIQAILGPTV